MLRIVAASVTAVLLSIALPLGAAPFEEGKDYKAYEEPHSTDVEEGKVEIREFFSYGCPHCFTFRPLLHEYLEKKAPEAVELVRVPVVFRREQWALLAKGYYAAQEMEVLDSMHKAIFNAIHVDNRKIESVEDLAAIADENDVDGEAFAESIKGSMTVDMGTRSSTKQVREYGVRSTPTVVVNGKYVISPRMAGGHERVIEVLDYLVKQELEE